jgi:hypothetical protein
MDSASETSAGRRTIEGLDPERTRSALPCFWSGLQLLFETVDFDGPVILMGAFAVFGEFGAFKVFGCRGFGCLEAAVKFGDVCGERSGGGCDLDVLGFFAPEFEDSGRLADGAEAGFELAAQLSASQVRVVREQRAAGGADLELGKATVHDAYPTPICFVGEHVPLDGYRPWDQSISASGIYVSH